MNVWKIIFMVGTLDIILITSLLCSEEKLASKAAERGQDERLRSLETELKLAKSKIQELQQAARYGTH